MKVSATANGVIIKAATVGIKNWFQERTIALVLIHAGEQALVFYMMTVKHYTKSANAMNVVKATALLGWEIRSEFRKILQLIQFRTF
jgi:hypothetical protein